MSQIEKQLKHDRFRDLGWELLEHKYRYYVLIKPIITDKEYDTLEQEYLQLAKELGKPATNYDMVEIDMSRPSCQLVARKLGKPKRNTRKKKIRLDK